MGKRIFEFADGVVQNIFSLIVLLLGVAIFLVAVFMYFNGQYSNCQCLLLVLIVCSMRNWKDHIRQKDKKLINEKRLEEKKNESSIN